MSTSEGRLNPKWIREARRYFKEFLETTKFPHPVRNGRRGSEFEYPEWLIMFIAVLAVKAKLKHYVAIRRMVEKNWDIIGQGVNPKPISERQLRDRLKKISPKSGRPPTFIFQIFPRAFLE